MKTKNSKLITTFLKSACTVVAGCLIAGQSQAAQSAPSQMTVSVGTYNGVASSLALASEGKVVNLYTTLNGNLTATFKYSTTGLGSGLSLSGRLRQHTSADVFTFQVLNSSGSWVKVTSATGGTTYKALTALLPSGSVVNGAVSIRLVSNSGADDLDVDQLVLVDGATTPTPTPTPTSSPTPTPTPVSSPTPTPTPTSTALKIPPGTSWYWQLQGTVNMNVNAKAYGIDMYDNSASVFASLKQSGHIVICYFSAGTYEDWRTDASSFPSSVLGSNVSGWPGERWLDVRAQSVRDIMMKRMDLAKSKGCDGIDPDNVDGYANKSGFPLTAQDQVNFNTFLADQAHARGLVIGLKNSTDLVSTLVSKFDFAVVEECFKYNECGAYSPFVTQNKAVFNAEYSTYSSSICSQAATLNFTTIFYNLGLDGTKYQPCP